MAQSTKPSILWQSVPGERLGDGCVDVYPDSIQPLTSSLYVGNVERCVSVRALSIETESAVSTVSRKLFVSSGFRETTLP